MRKLSAILCLLSFLMGCSADPAPAFCWECAGTETRLLSPDSANVNHFTITVCDHTEELIKLYINDNSVSRPDIGYWNSISCTKKIDGTHINP